MVKFSSYINALHPKKLQQFLDGEKEIDQPTMFLNFVLIAIFSLVTRFYSSLISKTATSPFSLLSVLWPMMGLLILCSILNFVATRFGAKSNFPKLLYLISILAVSVNIVTIPFYLIMPSADSKLLLLSCVLLIPLAVVVFYSVYRQYKVFSALYPSLDGNKPLIAYLVSFGLMFVISLVLVLFFNIS